MLASALVIPTERVPTLLDIKRALLSYDRIVLSSPEDRELISPQHFWAASSPIPLPIGVDVGPIKPLGKVPEYDDYFQKLTEGCSIAIKQGSLIVRSVPNYENDFYIGNKPPPSGEPNPRFVYQVYRALATDANIVAAISRGLEHLPPMSEEAVDALVPKGVDDGNITYLPEKALYPGFATSIEEKVLLTRLSHARLGSLVKGLAICEIHGLQPYTSDVGIASVIQMLDLRASEKISAVTERETDKVILSKLGWLHEIIISEFIDATVLNELSITQVLKLRSKAWGKAGEARASLYTALRKLAISDASKDEFENAARYALSDYRTARSELDAELGKRNVSSIVRQLKLEFSVEIKRPLRLFQGQPRTRVRCGICHVRGFINGLWSIDPDCSWQLGRGG
jgi:hypothetical protein